MVFRPEEVLFSPTTNCNLRCPHCDISRSDTVLPLKGAQKFLEECNRAGIRRVGFTGGEPFLALDFLCGIAKAAINRNMAFNRIMTNGVWYKNKEDLKKALIKLQRNGYDGSICVSVDAFHGQNIKKLAHFIETVLSIWRRPDMVSIAYTAAAAEQKTKKMLTGLAKLLRANFAGFGNDHTCIKSSSLFIKIHKIALSPVGKAAKLKDGWDGAWFKEDYCRGPGNILFVMPDGDVKPCCGYATNFKRLTIGNVKRDSAKDLMSNAAQNDFVSAVFNMGLTKIRKRLADLGVKFPGKSSNHCYFCSYLLTAIPKKILDKSLAAAKIALIWIALAAGMASASLAEAQTLKASKEYRPIQVKIVKKVHLPKGYHEGLFYDGANIWVNNGKEGNTWVIDTSSGALLSEVIPVAGFTEALTKKSDGSLFLTDWYEKKVYRVKIEGGKMAAESWVSVAPAFPAGLVWADSRFFVITWTRGFGTRFDLLEMDGNLGVINKIRIRGIQEPAHMAWDGENLWITSWYTRKVYRVNINKREITGAFPSPVSRTTGIDWDGKYLWLTGTSADLYELEVIR